MILANEGAEHKLNMNYSQSSTFAEGKKLIFNNRSKTVVTLIVERNCEPELLRLKAIVGKKYAKVLGNAFVTTRLESRGEKTVYETVIESEKDPRGLLRVVVFAVSVFLKISTLSSHRRFAKFVESNSR